MIDFETDRARLWWTYDSVAALRANESRRRTADETWCVAELASYHYDSTTVIFAAPDRWLSDGEPCTPLRFQAEDDGYWVHGDRNQQLRAVRAETQTSVILTGSWIRPGDGTGVFVAILPKRRTPEEGALAMEELAGVGDATVKREGDDYFLV